MSIRLLLHTIVSCRVCFDLQGINNFSNYVNISYLVEKELTVKLVKTLAELKSNKLNF